MLTFAFRVREKTKQALKANGKTEITNFGRRPVAPPGIVHALDLMCIPPPRRDGVPLRKPAKTDENPTKLRGHLFPQPNWAHFQLDLSAPLLDVFLLNRFRPREGRVSSPIVRAHHPIPLAT